MKVTVLDPVEPLTPREVSRKTGVPMSWLLRMLDRGKIKYARSSWLRLINSSDLDDIREQYDKYLSKRKKKRK